MAKKKNRKTCEKCGASVNINNYSQHISNAHGQNSGIGSIRNKLAIIAVVSIVLIAITGGYNSTLQSKQISSTSVSTDSSEVLQSNIDAEGNVVKIPISEIGTSAKWYTYDSNGVTTKYFAVKGNDGKIHVAIDACDVCYSSKLGYDQTNDVMTCNNCGQTFPIDSIGTENLSGGCWPSYLPYEIDGGNVIINTLELDKKQYMFQ